MGEEDKPEEKYTTKIFRKVRQNLPVKPKKAEEEKPVEAEPIPAEPMEVVEAEPVEAHPVQAVPVEPEVLGPPPPEEKKGFFSQFPKLYWVANTLELFERGAYYGMLAVMAVHMFNNLGIDATTVGLLFSMLLFFSYFWPLIASALAEKFGYKTVIMTSFVFLMAGYFITSTLGAGQMALLVIALLLMGFGAGTFKPLISATIAHVTIDKQRNLAYSLYYWFINFGAFIFPLMLGFAFPAEESYRWIFVVSGVLISVNVAITLIWYSNPIEPQRELSVSQAMRKILPALQDKKFRTLLFIYAGFWFMYAVNYSFLPPYMQHFHRMPGWFTVQWLAIINPGTIIVVGPALGKFMERYKSLNVMMVGIIIYSIGVLFTFWSNSEALFVTGIIIFSIGEFIVHPGFIAYVSKIAPKDKVAIYMGAIFVSTGVGISVGPSVMGLWYTDFVLNWHMPKLFGAAIVGVGFLTLACFILYNRWINKLAKQEDPTYKEDTSIWTKVTTSAVALMFIPIIIYAGFVGGTDTYYGPDEDDGVDIINWAEDYDVILGGPITDTGTLNEGESVVREVNVDPANIESISFIFSWEDEPDASIQHTNQPDEFTIEWDSPDGRSSGPFSEANPQGGSASMEFKIIYQPDKDPYLNGTGIYNVTITLDYCGDQEAIGSILGLRDQPDDSNSWSLNVDYEYYQKKE